MFATVEGSPIPGVEEAWSCYLRSRRLDDVGTDLEGADVPPPVPTLEQLQEMLMILRLWSVFPDGDSSDFIPPPASVTFISTSAAADRTSLISILPELPLVRCESRDTVRILGEDGAAVRNNTGLLAKLESALLAGKRIIAVVSRVDDYPTLLPVISANLVLPPPSGALLSIVLGFRHPGHFIEIDCPDAKIARLSPLQIASVLAAETIDEALERLNRTATFARPTASRTLDDVFGHPAAVAALRQAVRDMETWRSGRLAWKEVTRSFLLLGPPGTGKTFLAEALSGSAAVAFIHVNYSKLQARGHQGDFLAGFYAIVDLVLVSAPAVVFIDEVDSFFERGRSQNGYVVAIVNALLTALDQFAATEGVILIAATNDVKRVDPAVVRAGRFDRHLEIGPLDRLGLRAMLDGAFPGILAQQLNGLVDQLLGTTGAEIAALVRDAQTRARSASRTPSAEHVLQSADALRLRADPELMSRIAVHEAGHLLAAHLLGLPPAKSVSIRAFDGSVLHSLQSFQTPSTLRAYVHTSLAGRAAEQLVLGNTSSGSGVAAGSDLDMATTLTRRAELSYGFGTSLSWYPADTPLAILPADLRARVEDALQLAQTEVTDLLRCHLPALEHIARVLLDRREMDGFELTALLAEAVSSEVLNGCPDPGAIHDE